MKNARIYIYDHTYPGRERQGTQYRDDDMWCDRKISHHRKKEKKKWSRTKIDRMILHRRKRKNNIQYEGGACNTHFNPH